MANVTYDDRSFLIDGRRIWLVSGSVHYFRIPHELWRDRLLKAKRAGLNCISTYVAWNFHESQEGEWDFSGDKDIVEFVRLANELGLYVILRPGPYICGEWDFGGLPAWLTTKTGIAYRTSNAVYTHYYDKYFRQILPKLAELQITRGGNIVLVQNENEYFMTTSPDRLNYLEFINTLFRRGGFDIPIISCNLFSTPAVPETIECANGWGNEVQLLKKLRLKQPNAPLLMTEYWCGWFDCWGSGHHTRDARQVARRAMEILGCGSQYNLYMFHGGTNFEFWGSRLSCSDSSYQTTSYDFDAPIAEGGGLTEKYYSLRLVNMFARQFGSSLAGMKMDPPGVSVHDSTNVLNLSGPSGRWAVISNGGNEQIKTAKISLPEGEDLEVTLEPLGATAVPVGVRLADECRLDYANLMPLGFFSSNHGKKVLVFHAPAGWDGLVCVNGSKINSKIPAGDEPKIIETDEVLVVFINSDLAKRTWLLDDKLIFGPDFVGENEEQIRIASAATQYAWLSLSESQLRHKKLKPAATRKARAPQLRPWKRISVCMEPAAKDMEWKSISGPHDVDSLGINHGYLWYRLEIDQPRLKKRYLFLPECEDRAIVYLNGNLVGTWGRGEGATRQPMPAQFKRGKNVIVMLVDNLGRVNFGPRLGEQKGLYGHVFDAKGLRTTKFKLAPMESFPKRVIPRQQQHMLAMLEKLPVWKAELSVPLTKVAPVHISFADIPNSVAVLCNDRTAGFFNSAENNFGDVTLGNELVKGKNIIRLILWGDVDPKSLEKVKFFSLNECISEKAAWSYRPWDVPVEGGPIVGKDRPAWYMSKFRYSPADKPLFLNITSAKKGQVLLNGRNIGRHWNVGPQEKYFLPECWLKDENELLIFDEQGAIPSRSSLCFCPKGPFGQ